MLDDTLKAQLAAYLERVTLPFEMVASLGDDDNSRQMRELLQTIQSLRTDKITPAHRRHRRAQAIVHAAARRGQQQPALCRPAAGP